MSQTVTRPSAPGRSETPHRVFDPDVARTRRWALAAVVAMLAAQLVFLTVGCDWELIGDEAEYWTWSRRLDWAYYCRGPLIAVLIRLSTALAGSTMLAVRLPAVLMGVGTAWGVYRLGVEVVRDARAGLVALLLIPAVPIFRLGGVLITVDTPLVFFWTWAALWAYRGFVRDEVRCWLCAGLLGALGVLTKYTMLAFPASVGLFLLLEPGGRRHLLRPGFWVLAAGCLLGTVPIIAWNASHGWIGGMQFADRVGLTAEARPGALKTVGRFLAGEFLVMGVWWWFGLLGIGRAVAQVVRSRGPSSWTSGGRTVTRHSGDEPTGLLYLLCLWVVVWSACLASAARGETEMNWSAPGLVSVVVLIGWWFERRVVRQPGARRAWGSVALWAVSVLALTGFQHTEWFYPRIAGAVPAATAERPAPLRVLDPTCRLRGVRELAPEVARRVAALRALGLDPFILAPTYAMAATLEFYLPDQATVYCLASSTLGPRHPANQHDLWHPNPRLDPEAFRGRPAVTVHDANSYPSFAGTLAYRGWFRNVDVPALIPARRHGLAVAAWEVTVCHDYQGPPTRPAVNPASVKP